MRPRILSFATAILAAATAVSAGASVSGFRLPGEQPQQAPPPDVQGPVAPDVPASRRAPTPTPTPSATRVETPAAAPPAVEVPTDLQAPTSATPTRRAAAAPSVAPSADQRPDAVDFPIPEQSSAPVSSATAPPPPTPSSTNAVGASQADADWSWLWLLGIVPLGLAALALLGWFARRWVRRPIRPVAVPEIERPRVGPAAVEPRPAPATPAEPLQVSLEPLRLSLSLMNATLTYRLELANRGSMPITGLAIGADMIAAHASMSREEQLAGPQMGNGVAARRIERLEPGETQVVEGEFRLPFPQIVPIRQGDAALLLPLARFRVEAEGARPLVRTFVVGQPGQGNGLQPFRLDQGPRVYPRLAQHAFA